MTSAVRLAVHAAALAGLAAVALALGRWLRDPEPNGALLGVLVLSVICFLALRRLYGAEGPVALSPRSAGEPAEAREEPRAPRERARTPGGRERTPDGKSRAPRAPRKRERRAPAEHLWGKEAGEPSGPAPPPTAAAPISAAAVQGGLIDLNTASDDALQTLPGIGPRMAVRIVNGRPYASVEDLRNVAGFTAKRVEELLPLVRV